MPQRNERETWYFDCPLCEQPLDVRLTKKQKPYVTCSACSLQMFVRGSEGMRRMEKALYTIDPSTGKRGPTGEEGRPDFQAALAIPEPQPKRPRGRPRKDSDSYKHAERAASKSPVAVLTGRGL